MNIKYSHRDNCESKPGGRYMHLGKVLLIYLVTQNVTKKLHLSLGCGCQSCNRLIQRCLGAMEQRNELLGPRRDEALQRVHRVVIAGCGLPKLQLFQCQIKSRINVNDSISNDSDDLYEYRCRCVCILPCNNACNRL